MNLKKVFSGLVFGIIIGIMLFYILKSKYEYQQFRQQTTENIIYWKSIVGENNNYPDGWVKLAINWHRLGEDELAQLAINKAARLDPINDEIKNIKVRLRNRKPNDETGLVTLTDKRY